MENKMTIIATKNRETQEKHFWNANDKNTPSSFFETINNNDDAKYIDVYLFQATAEQWNAYLNTGDTSFTNN